MKKTWLLVLLLGLLGLVGLSGCGAKMESADMADIEDKRMTRYTTCVTARKEADTARMTAIAKLSPEQTAMVMMGDAMIRQAEALAGKDPCGQGMNAFEMETAIAKSRNETIGTLGGTALRVGGTVGGAFIAADAIKSVAKTAGNKTEITGDGNTYSNEQVTSNSEQRIDTGDESRISATAPTVSGPDKGAETIHEAPAASPATLATAATE